MVVNDVSSRVDDTIDTSISSKADLIDIEYETTRGDAAMTLCIAFTLLFMYPSKIPYS